MTSSYQPGASCGGGVVFRALTERLDDPRFANSFGVEPERAKRTWAALVMTDHGDHVEWTDGSGRVWKWRLPDQPSDLANYPTVQTVLVAGFRNPWLRRDGVYRIRFLDPSGATLGRFNPTRNPLMRTSIPRTILELVLPPEAFEGLRRHGVNLVVEQSYTSEKAFYEAHPDPEVNRLTLLLARNRWLLPLLLVVFVFVLALILTFVQTG